jgi:Amt family ammonium transporter
MPGHSSVLQALGVFILWVGWYGFNCGSTLSIYSDSNYARDAARVAVTTTLGGGSGALSMFVLTYLYDHVWDMASVGNGVLAGLVSVTAGCATIDPWAAICTGLVGGCILNGASKLMVKCKIDDPIDAFAVHGVCGMWGLVAVGVFSRPEYTYNLQGRYGFIWGGADGTLLLAQFVLILIIWLWVGSSMTVVFLALKYTGKLRVPAEVEEAGLDDSKHGGTAYNFSK